MRYTITVGFVFVAFLHNVLHYINVEVVLFCLFILIVVKPFLYTPLKK